MIDEINDMSEFDFHEVSLGAPVYDICRVESDEPETKSHRDWYKVSVLLSLLCFFMPTGICAVIYSREARKAQLREDKRRAAENSKSALIAIFTTVLTIPILLTTVILLVVYAPNISPET